MKHTWLIGLSAAVGVALYGMNVGYGADKDPKSVTTTAKKPVAAAPTTAKTAAAKPVPENAAKKDHAPFRFRMRHRLTPEQGKQMEAINAKYQKPEADLQQQIAKLQHELAQLESERGAETAAVLQECGRVPLPRPSRRIRKRPPQSLLPNPARNLRRTSRPERLPLLRKSKSAGATTSDLA